MKREETVLIEQALIKDCFGANPKLAKEYGAVEVTIGFQRNHQGHEIVDFMSYDAGRDTFRCCEIKVSMADFHSKAKKSWCGNLNYLVISQSLYAEQSAKDWREELPATVGLIVYDLESGEKKTIFRATKQEISSETKEMLKRSLIRSLFYQNIKQAK